MQVDVGRKPVYQHNLYRLVQTSPTNLRFLKRLLALSDKRYQAIVEDQTDLISRFKADGTFTFVNDVYCTFFGKSKSELLNNKWFPIAHPDDIPHIKNSLAKLSPSNPVVTIENRVYSATGEVKWVQFVNRAFFTACGQLIETQSVGRDISILKEAEESLKNYARRLTGVEESLRRKLSAEIHDGIAQDLTVLGMGLSVLYTKIASGNITDIQSRISSLEDKVGNISRTIRRLMSDLHPPVLDDYGLVSAVNWYAESLFERTGIKIDVKASRLFPLLSQEIEMSLFRIAQEILTDAINHSLNKLLIRLRRIHDKIQMEVVYVGKGSTFAPTTNSLMQERAKSVGGILEITHTGKNETSIIVTVPAIFREDDHVN